MDEGLPSVSIFLFLLILLVDILVHGFGVALSHIKEEEVERKAQDDKDQISEKILKLIDKEAGLIKSMHFSYVVLNMILGGIVTTQISEYFISCFGIESKDSLGSVVYLCVGAVIAVVILCFGVLIPRRLAARVVHLFMTRILNIPDIDWDEALKLRDIYECRSCANAIAQVYQRGIMLPIDEDRFGLSEDVTPEALERIIDRLYCVEL